MHVAVISFIKSLRHGASVVLLVSAVGCGGSSAGPTPAEAGSGAAAGTGATGAAANAAQAATFSDIYAMIFPRTTNAHCDMCHGLPPFDESNGNLSTGMTKDSTYAALVGKMSTSSKCKGRMYVVAGHPEMSLLVQKLLPNPPCGLPMPNGGKPLSDAQIDMIRSWISAGAQDN